MANNQEEIEKLPIEERLRSLKLQAEIARSEEERKKIELERKELERKSKLHWWRKPLFIQAIIAGIIAVPLIWFYVKDVALPLSRRENIKLSRQLIKEKDKLDEANRQHEIKVNGYIEDLKENKTRNQNLVEDYTKIINVVNKLSNRNNELKDNYSSVIKELEAQKVEIEKKTSAISKTIKQEVKIAKARKSGEYISVEKAKLLYLDLEGRPQNYTNNQFEEMKVNNGIVLIDHATNLMWEKSGSDKSMDYENAKKYIETRNREQYAGKNDWRLPTLKEAITLLEQEGDSIKLYIDLGFDKQQEMIWTSDKTNASSVWVVYFSYGHCYSSNFSHLAYVRAVR